MNDELSRVVAVCGGTSAERASLLEQVVPTLVDRGLRVAVVMSSSYEPAAPAAGPGEMLGAGATVLTDPGEDGGRPGSASPRSHLRQLEQRHDLVILEGDASAPAARVWLRGSADPLPPDDSDGELGWLAEGDQRAERFLGLVEDRLQVAWAATPIRAGILVGGASRRMGRPKSELTYRGLSFLEIARSALAGLDVWQLGEGGGQTGLPDASGVRGPLAGLLSAVRFDPHCAWVLVACDQPLMTSDAVAWLLDQRRPGRWVILPQIAGRAQPLLAVYEPLAGSWLEAMAAEGKWGLAALAGRPQVWGPEPPPEHAAAWTNVNTPQELAALPAGLEEAPGVEGA